MNKILLKSVPLLLVVSSLSLASCSGWNDEETFQGFTNTVLVNIEDIVLADNEFHDERQMAYLSSTWDTYEEFTYGRMEYSIPRGIKLNLNSVNDKYVQYSKTFDFTNSITINLGENNTYLKNLEAGTKYFYRTGESETNFSQTIHEVEVANTLPRNVHVDGVTNVRDLGGYESKLGGKIKQGLYYRGARLNYGSDGPIRLITDEGYDTLVNVLKVKNEIDLRSSLSETGNMNNEFFPDIEYHSIKMNTREIDNIMTQHKLQIKEAFKLFSNPETYPVYVHCTIGTDRTGMVSYLMGALLGMKNDDLTRDYLFSNFGDIGSLRSEVVIEDNYYTELKKYEKPTLQLCAEAFLLECGVTQAEINSIKSIFIEK